MKTEQKKQTLIENGFSTQSLSQFNEKEIGLLYNKIVSEQVTSTKGQTMVSSKNPNAADIAKNLNAKGVNVSMTEESDEDNKNNPFSICTAQLGKVFKTTKRSEWSAKQTAKYERCVRDVKKSLKEGKNPVTLFFENKIMELLETHLPPKITKKDLVKYLSEAEPATAPVKEPKTKPGTKEPPSPVKTPLHPGKNPNPGVKEAPKAIDAEKAKEKIIDTIMKMLKK